MLYKTSNYNYIVENENELLILNFKKGLSSFRIVTDNEINEVKDYLSRQLLDIGEANEVQKNLISGGFIIEESRDEEAELELRQMDYIYNSTLHLVIHVTKDCNFRCKYCFIDFVHHKLEPIVQNKIVDYIRINIKKYSGVYISWFGGEPLMGVDVIEDISNKVIDICKAAKKPYLAGVTTNGYLLTPVIIEKLISLKVYNYCITLDGLKDSHDNQRVLMNGGPTFQRIVDNLLYIKNKISFRYLTLCIRTNFTKTTLGKINEYLDFFNSKFGDDHRFVPLFKLASDWGGERVDTIRAELLTPQAMKTIYESVIARQDFLTISNTNSLYFGGMTCNAVRKNKYTIGVDGIIAKCDTACKETQIGYIDDSGWHIDSSKETQWILAYKKQGDNCKTCQLRSMCFQGCCPKKKVLNDNAACPIPVYIDQLLSIYRKTMEARKDEMYERS